MSIQDIRGFHYALEPARLRAAHRHELALARLGHKLRALEALTTPIEALAASCSSLSLRLTPIAASRLDPTLATHGAQHLGSLHSKLSIARLEVRSLQADVQRARAELGTLRAELEAFEAHRAEALAEHGLAAARRMQVAADQDWLSRVHLRPNAGEEGGGT